MAFDWKEFMNNREAQAAAAALTATGVSRLAGLGWAPSLGLGALTGGAWWGGRTLWDHYKDKGKGANTDDYGRRSSMLHSLIESPQHPGYAGDLEAAHRHEKDMNARPGTRKQRREARRRLQNSLDSMSSYTAWNANKLNNMLFNVAPQESQQWLDQELIRQDEEDGKRRLAEIQEEREARERDERERGDFDASHVNPGVTSDYIESQAQAAQATANYLKQEALNEAAAAEAKQASKSAANVFKGTGNQVNAERNAVLGSITSALVRAKTDRKAAGDILIKLQDRIKNMPPDVQKRYYDAVKQVLF